jgi:hypothetical protein
LGALVALIYEKFAFVKPAVFEKATQVCAHLIITLINSSNKAKKQAFFGCHASNAPWAAIGLFYITAL